MIAANPTIPLQTMEKLMVISTYLKWFKIRSRLFSTGKKMIENFYINSMKTINTTKGTQTEKCPINTMLPSYKQIHEIKAIVYIRG